MKFKKLIILSIFLLAILTIGAVSAEDNMTGEAVPTDDTVFQDDAGEEIPNYLEGDDWPSEIDIRCRSDESDVLKGDPVYFTKTITDGNLDVSIDGVKKDAIYEWADEVDARYKVPTTGLVLGKHILNVKVTHASDFVDAEKNFTFFIRDIVVNVPKAIVIDDISSYNDMSVRVNSADAGKLVVAIDNKTYTYKDVSKADKTYSLNNLSAFGNPHIIKVSYTTAKGVVYNETFAVNTTYIQIDGPRDRKYYEGSRYLFHVPKEFSRDKINVRIDNQPVGFSISSSDDNVIYYNVDLSSLGLGEHEIVVTYDGDDKFAPCSSSAIISVYPNLIFSDDSITIDEDINVSLYGPATSVYTLSVFVDGKLYDSKKSPITIAGLGVGKHKIQVKISGEGYTYRYTKTVHVYVDIKGSSSLDVGKSGKFTVKYPYCNGNLTVDFGSEKVISQFINGTANVTIPSTLKVGRYDVRFIYDDEDHPFNVSKYLAIEPVFHVPNHVVNGNGAIYMKLPYDDPVGKFVVEVYNAKDKYSFSAKFKAGKASIPVTSLNEGKYTVFPKYFNGTDWFYHGVVEMTVRNSKLTASDLTKYYGSSTGFKVKVANYNGLVMKGEYVKFYINGKYVKKVKTDKHGYATLKIGKAPGTYKISAKYGKVMITRNLKVKHAVTLKTVTVKKSAKSLVLKATLKKGKTPIRYKYVKFYFNGKFIKKVKTSKYGVAKVTIKKTVLKKLKVGKTVKYQATYLKDTVKKSAKVKK